MKNSRFTCIVSLLLALTLLICSGTSCKSKKEGTTTTGENENEIEKDDGSALATTRYEFDADEYNKSSGGTDELLGTISSANGLLWYKFDEAPGATVLYSSLSSPRDSTGMKGVKLIKDGGVDGGAISFDGKSSVRLNNPFTSTSQITDSTFLHPAYSALSVAFYIKPSSFESNQLIYEQGDSNCGLAVGIADGKIKAAIGAANSKAAQGKVTTLECEVDPSNAEKWLHVALTFDGLDEGGTFSLYIDGVQNAKTTGVGQYIPQTIDPAGLGSVEFGTNTLSLTGSSNYSGLMDDLRIYSICLTYSGELEENAVFLQSAAAKNYYIKAGTTPTISAMVEANLRGFVLTYGLSDREGYSFRQTGTSNFIINDNGTLTIGKADTDSLKNGATFYMEDALIYPSWSGSQRGAFRSYKSAADGLYLANKSGKLTLCTPSENNLLSCVFKVTGDQTKVISGLKGAVYYPSYALNAPQFWKWYDHEIIDRDMGYATDILGVNAFRIWVSYEYWLEDSEHFDAAFRDFLDLAESHGIVIMVSLFEGCGNSYNYNSSITWSREYTGTKASWSVTSPSAEIYNARSRWNEPKRFVTYFIENFGDDNRLMAIETYNEPWGSRSSLAMYLTDYAVSIQKSVPLTIGSAPADPINIVYSVEAGMDMIHYHDNFPSSADGFYNNAKTRIDQGALANLPVYCTEVQWVGGPQNINYPVYSNLAPTCERLMKSGNWAPFYWTLMVHPCYLDSYRNSFKMFNGIINEDGSVYSSANANAIKGSSCGAKQKAISPYNDGSYSYRYNFSDSFFDLHAYKWTFNSASFSASTGSLCGSGLCFANSTDFDDLEATLEIEGSGGLVIRAKDKDNYYLASLENGKLAIYKIKDGSKELLSSTSVKSAKDAVTICVIAEGASITLKTDSGEVKASDNEFTSGLIGLYSETDAAFDNISIHSVK